MPRHGSTEITPHDVYDDNVNQSETLWVVVLQIARSTALANSVASLT